MVSAAAVPVFFVTAGTLLAVASVPLLIVAAGMLLAGAAAMLPPERAPELLLQPSEDRFPV